MNPIDIESSGKNTEETIADVPLQSVHYKDIGLTYEFIDSNGEKWFHQIVGEFMLGVRTRQFDYYCKNDLVPPIVKRRVQTSRYSYNFIKEADIFRIAKAKGKILRMPLKDIPTTDTNEKVFSKTDVESMAKNVVNDQALAIFKNYDLRIHDLESKNDHLYAEVNRLTTEKSEIIETKSKEIDQLVEEKSRIIEMKSKEINQIVKENQEIIGKKAAEVNKLSQEASQLAIDKANALNRKRAWENATIALIVFFVIGGGAVAVYVYNTYKDNDRLYDVKNTQAKIILSKDSEIYNLNEKMKTDEIQYLKSQIPVTQNAELNAVKKH